MWTVAASNKKFADALGTYNSLQDPHLHQYFRKPKVKKHLIQVGLLTHEGKIVTDTVVKLQKLETERRMQLHALLEEVLENGVANRNGLKKLYATRHLESQEKSQLVMRAKLAFDGDTVTHDGDTLTHDGDTLRGPPSSGVIRKVLVNKTHKTKHSPNNWFKRVTIFGHKRISRIFSPKSSVSSLKHNKKVSINVINKHRPKSSYGVRSPNKISPENGKNKSQTDADFIKDAEELSAIVSLDGESLHDSDDGDGDKYDNRRHHVWDNRRLSQSTHITLQFNGITMKGQKSRLVKIMQQLYSGGNAIVIFNKMVTPGEHFTIITKRRENQMFCITILIDNIRDLRISTCCEFKHKVGSRISHFTIIKIDGGNPCKCCAKSKQIIKKHETLKNDTINNDNLHEHMSEMLTLDVQRKSFDENCEDNDNGDNDYDVQIEEFQEIQIQYGTSEERRLSNQSDSVQIDNYVDEFETYDSSGEESHSPVMYKKVDIINSSPEDEDSGNKQFETKVDVHINP